MGVQRKVRRADFGKIIIRRSGDYWVALCLENGVVAQGSTKERAIGKLEEAIGSLERVYRKDRDVCCRQISMKELQEFLTV